MRPPLDKLRGVERRSEAGELFSFAYFFNLLVISSALENRR